METLPSETFQESSLPLPSVRASDDSVANYFRRLRGAADDLRGGNRQPLRDYLVLLHSSLVDHCARTFLSSGEPLEDLLQEGSIGLIKAVDRFDPDKGVRFSTYACHLIAGEMRHYLRDLGKMIHEPGWHAELRGQILRATDDLTQKLGRPPQAEEIASALDMQTNVVRRVLDSGNVLAVTSLDTESEDENGAPKLHSYDETDSALEPLSTSVENRLTLNAAIPQLRDLEQRAVTLFYYGEHSKTEIARQMGISVNYAAYLVKRGVEHLRRIIESEAPVQTALPAPPLPLAWSAVSRWIEENMTYNGTMREFALLLCVIPNWNEATSRLNEAERSQAEQGAAIVMRRSCRKADKVVTLSDAPFVGLSFLALMPNTAATGERAADRWCRACTMSSILAAANPEVANLSANDASPQTSAALNANVLNANVLNAQLGELESEYSFVFSEDEDVHDETDEPLHQHLQGLMQDVLSRRPFPMAANSVQDGASGSSQHNASSESDGLSMAADGIDDAPRVL